MNLPTKQADGSGRFYEYVIDNIRQMIADGELQAGQKLPSERELAEKFNVSRVPIREALKILEYMGVLDSSPGDGTYVKNTSAQSLVSKMDFSFDATADTIRDLLELRIVLETFAAYHAAQRRTDEDIASIQKLLRDMREAKKVNDGTEESVQNLRKLSHGFHQALVRARRGRRRRSIRMLGGDHVDRTQLVGILGIGLHIIGDLLALLKGLEAVAHDGGEVHEHVVAALVVGDEAEALGLVEPLDSTVIHNGTS